jgi:predicted RNase H-like nuclease (RuvC/YqgF family)
MSEYKCETCEIIFTNKSHYDYHVTNGECKQIKFKCKMCGKVFTTNNSMYRHMKHTCKVKKQAEDEKNKIYEKLLHIENNNKILEQSNKKLEQSNKELKATTNKIVNENKKLKQEMKKIKKTNKSDNNGTINNVNNVNNGIVANITLVGYGKEDISKINRNDMLKILQNGYNSTIKLTETLHFNPKYPEYQNIYISNMKDKYAMIP